MEASKQPRLGPFGFSHRPPLVRIFIFLLLIFMFSFVVLLEVGIKENVYPMIDVLRFLIFNFFFEVLTSSFFLSHCVIIIFFHDFIYISS